jgi:hypothetical protein
MKKGVSGLGLGPASELLRRETEGALDEGIYEGIYYLDALMEGATGYELV